MIAKIAFNILWAPEYKGKYVIAENEYMHNRMLTALALGYPRDSIHKFDALNNNVFRAKITNTPLKTLIINLEVFGNGISFPFSS